MFGSPRIGWKPLSQLCRRLSTALGAGLDARRVLERESQSGTPWQKRQLGQVRDAIDHGDGLSEAFARTGGYFPRFFLEMLDIGEQTGKLDHVLPKLADYYEHLVQLRRIFLIGIAWPAIQLLIAVGVIGLLIWALGVVGQMTGQQTDILGFGLVGTAGLIRYLIAISLLVIAGMVLFRLCTRGPLANMLSQLLMRIPGLGPNLRMMSLARISWALGLALDSGADARKSVRLALSTAGGSYYGQHVSDVDLALRSGSDIHSALRQTAAFPTEFLDALEVGEESGRTSEVLLKLADDYRERAKATMAGVTVIATMAVWGLVATILILLIFRVFGFYLSILDDAAKGF